MHRKLERHALQKVGLHCLSPVFRYLHHQLIVNRDHQVPWVQPVPPDHRIHQQFPCKALDGVVHGCVRGFLAEPRQPPARVLRVRLDPRLDIFLVLLHPVGKARSHFSQRTTDL